VGVDAPFAADGEASESAHPGEDTLDDPAVPAELLAALDTAPGDARLDPAAGTGTAAAAVAGGFAGVPFIRPVTRPTGLAADGRDGVKQVFEAHAVVDAGSGQPESERDRAPSREPDGDPWPRRSVMMGRFVPALPRSVGFGPMASPPFSPGWRRCPDRPGSSRSAPPPAGAAAVPDAAGPKPRPPATPAAAASRSPPTHTPSPAGASPREGQT
jgi:hypothetical protein